MLTLENIGYTVVFAIETPYEKVEVDTDEIIGLQCGKCHDLVMDEGVECSSLKEGKCLPKGMAINFRKSTLTL